MNRETFRQNILELIRRTSAFLPPDVESVINLQRKLETSGSKAEFEWGAGVYAGDFGEAWVGGD